VDPVKMQGAAEVAEMEAGKEHRKRERSRYRW